MTFELPPMEPFADARTWKGADLMQDTGQWLLQLGAEDIADLEQAANHYLSLGRDVGEITAADFPLQSFDAHLKALGPKLVDGIGFEVIRGLPIERYSREMTAAIFCGIGAHLGSARSQNAMGHILGHVRNTGADPKSTNTRFYQTAQRQTFHTDSSDVVGLLCLRNAKEGGDSLLVSVQAIFNRMLEERPDLLKLLFDPIATDRRGEVPEGELPYMEIPPLTWHKEHLTVFYQRQYINSGQRFPEAMRLTPDHVAALDLFDEIANDPEMHLMMRLEPGDMQFVYNHSFLHDRTGFTDYEDPDRRRHLFRLWLSMPGDRELPACFKVRYGSIEIGKRGGIVTPETKLQAPLD